MTDDEEENARGERLGAVAGVSREAPLAEYAVEGEGFGRALLQRRMEYDGRWTSLTLELGPAEIAAVSAKGGAPEERVSFGAGGDTFHVDAQPADTLTGLRELLVEHRLLSCPELMWVGRDEVAPAGTPAAKALDALRGALIAKVRLGRRPWTRLECAPCRALREERARATADVEVERLQKLIAAARTKSEAARWQRELHERRRVASQGVSMRWAMAPREAHPCPHEALYYAGLEALCRRHPVLAFEAAGVLRPAFGLHPPRFVLQGDLMKAVLARWLVGRARGRYDDWYGGYGYRSRRASTRVSASRLREAEGERALSPEHRAGVVFAATAWEASGAPERLARRVGVVADEGPLVLGAEATPDERVEVAAVLPEGVTLEAPKAAETTVARRKPRPTKRAPKEESTTKSATPTATLKAGEELMTSDLRARGLSDADIKRMLKEGTLERAGFGWYRVIEG